MPLQKNNNLSESLKQSQHDLSQAQRIGNIGHWELDLEKNQLFWSDQVFRIFELEPQSIIPSYELFLSFIHPDDHSLVNNAYRSSIKNHSSYQITHRVITKQGNLKYVEERCEHQLDEHLKVVKSIGTIQDITSSVENAKALKLASSVFVNSNDAILITDKENKIVTVNRSFEKMTGYLEEEIVGLNPNVLSSGWGDKDFYEKMWHEILTKGIWKGNIQDKRKNGELYTIEQSIIAVKDSSNNIESFIGIANDITELLREQDEKNRALTTSRIGGLKNRYALFEALKKFDIRCAALIDINRFHQLNNFYGYDISDQLLTKVSELINSQYKNRHTLYHFNADTFVITKDPDSSVVHFEAYIKEIINLIENSNFIVDEYEISLSVTGVIANTSTDNLIKTLDMALIYAKEKHLQYWMHNEISDISQKFQENLHWAKELKRAFKEDRVVVFYQAIYSLHTNEIERYEALVRLKTVDGDIITPDFFLAAAEYSNQMFQLTKTVFLKTLDMLTQCRGVFTFSINISTADIENPHFLALIEEYLDDYPYKRNLCFEILETKEIANLESVGEFVKLIHALGCKIAIDDFGSGFANFENLINLEIDIVKIDGTLIEKIATNQGAYDIVDSIVNFAKKREMRTIAEYVKNRAIFDIAKKIGVDMVQGYYIDKPKEELHSLITDHVVNSNEPFKTLIYVSESVSTTTYDDAVKILNTSWSKNRENGIGGVLLYNRRFFIQLLNGPVDKVDQIFHRIKEDKRHHNIRLVGEEFLQEQEFDEWNMGFLAKSTFIMDILKKHNIEDYDGFYHTDFVTFKELLKELTLYI